MNSIANLLQTLRITPMPSSIVDLKSSKTSPLELTEKVTHSPSAEFREIPLSEVAMHDDYCDCWIVIYDRVYDVTKFLSMHPGGEDVIMDYAGRDASLAFRGTGHSQDANEMLKDFLIGVLPEHERIFRKAQGSVFLIDVPE